MLAGNTSAFTSNCLTRFEKSRAAGNFLEEKSVLNTFRPEEMFSVILAPYILQKTPALVHHKVHQVQVCLEIATTLFYS